MKSDSVYLKRYVVRIYTVMVSWVASLSTHRLCVDPGKYIIDNTAMRPHVGQDKAYYTRKRIY